MIAISDRDQLLMTSRSSIALLGDRGKPYLESDVNVKSKELVGVMSQFGALPTTIQIQIQELVQPSLVLDVSP